MTPGTPDGPAPAAPAPSGNATQVRCPGWARGRTGPPHDAPAVHDPLAASGKTLLGGPRNTTAAGRDTPLRAPPAPSAGASDARPVHNPRRCAHRAPHTGRSRSPA